MWCCSSTDSHVSCLSLLFSLSWNLKQRKPPTCFSWNKWAERSRPVLVSVSWWNGLKGNVCPSSAAFKHWLHESFNFYSFYSTLIILWVFFFFSKTATNKLNWFPTCWNNCTLWVNSWVIFENLVGKNNDWKEQNELKSCFLLWFSPGINLLYDS